MKNILVSFLTIVVIGSGISTSSADIYISGGLGAVLLEDSNFDEGPFNGKFAFDVGPVFLIAVGSAVETGGRMSTQNGGRVTPKDHARLELELGYRKNDIDKIKINGLGSAGIDGYFSSLSLMANLFYDFSAAGGITPYIGAGGGVANVKGNPDDVNSRQDAVAAGQFIFGASYPATDSLIFDLQYRYFATDDADLGGTDYEYRTHNLMLGFRQSF